MGRVGDTVSIEFSSSDATTAALVTIKDSNLVTRTLQSFERLMIDHLEAAVATAAGNVDVFADSNADGNVGAGERLAAFTSTSTCFEGPFEGLSLPIGITPKVKAAGAGAVTINGSGRIVIGQSQGQYPAWQATRITTGSEG